MWNPYGPQWPQGPQQSSGVVYIPMQVPTETKRNGKPRSTKHFIREMMETQKAFEEFQKSTKKPDDKKDDGKPKVPMYSFGQMVLAIFAASPFLGLGMLMIFKQMAASIFH